jgi:hypothetical protein
MIAEGLDNIFENASELDILFNPEKVYMSYNSNERFIFY